MKRELREKILAYNRALAQRKEKAQDLDILLAAFLKLPPGQLKQILTEDVMAVFAKYGLVEG